MRSRHNICLIFVAISTLAWLFFSIKPAWASNCNFDPVSGTVICEHDDGGGGGGGGTPTPPPGPPPPGDPPPGNPPPGQPPGPPAPTPAPPPGMPGGGRYVTACDAFIPNCPYGFSVVRWWCVTGGHCYVISARCAAEGECEVSTRPTPNPPPDPGTDWPCQDVPNVYPGGIDQTCDDWEWQIRVVAQIPPAQVLRNPWPRSLVGLPTKFWYVGATERVEAFSAGRAFPCNVEHGRVYGVSEPLPTCPAPVGGVLAGTRVNRQLGAAWQRWVNGAPPLFGFRPPYEALLTIEDRAWNGGPRAYEVLPGSLIEHTFETSSYGLIENGPLWNPACQEQLCTCDARVQSWDMPAYQGGVQTWWYPQWTWRYDEFQCVHQDWGPCFYRDAPPIGQTWQNCDGNGDGSADANWYQLHQCTGWAWRTVTEPWNTYDLRKLGYTPIIPWGAVESAGADGNGLPCGSFGPGLPIPVIELQAILTPR